ncbi:MAG: hypothetical protein AAGF20_07940 [Pseudomonadota bacterium]
MRDNQFVKNRNGHWHYNRAVPKLFISLDTREQTRRFLRTRSVLDAQIRRDAQPSADHDY